MKSNSAPGQECFSPTASESSDSETVNILLVDDTPGNLVALEAVLADLGQNIIKAGSGEEALRHLLRHDFAAIILDVNMPGLNGFETATLIRQRKSSECTPIIFVSAISTSDTHKYQGYALGAVDYIFTPIVPDVLRSKVGVFVELLKKTNEVRRQADKLQSEIQVRKKAEAALKETNSELESFSYSVSHDLRAPLRAMQAFADALLEDYSGKLDATGQDFTRRIVAAAGRMERLIDDLLAYSRISYTELKLQAVNPEGTLQECLSQQEAAIRQTGALVMIEPPFFAVRAHPPTLLQILSNLLSNAIKFVSPNTTPKVRIRMEKREGFGRLWVEDNGIGVEPKYQSQIFRVFERLHGVETYPGTGIGLAIVRKGAERMGGRAGIESTPGQGSKFWVEFPLVQPNSAAE